MRLIGHYTIGEEPHPHPLTRFRQHLLERLIITILSRPNFLTSGHGGSSNSLYTAIEVLQSPLNELGEARQRKALSVKPQSHPAWHLGEDPPQMPQHVEQEESQGQQHEA